MKSNNIKETAIIVLVLFSLIFSIPKYSISQVGDTTKKVKNNPTRPKEQSKNTVSPNDWKKSWDVFIKELIIETKGVPGEKASENVKTRFAKKQVIWEGTIDGQFPADGSATTIKMQPDINTPGLQVKFGNYTGDGTVLLHLKPATSQVFEWTKLTPGTKVKFKAIVGDDVYLTLGPTINIMINTAEILK